MKAFGYRLYFTPAEEGGFHFGLSVCPSDNWHGPGTKGIHFGDDPDHHPDPRVRCPKSVFTGLSKKLPMDVDEILWTVGVWPRDQLITFGGNPHHYPDSGVRSGSRSRSGKNCHIVNTHRTDAFSAARQPSEFIVNK